ncbi:MAG: hypothetical protein WBG20_02675, partial [Candidatus Deferrimicrobiaceae bacterium]
MSRVPVRPRDGRVEYSTDPGSRGEVPSATLAIFARSLPVPLAKFEISLHRPPRGLPHASLRVLGCRRSSRRRGAK